MNTEDSLPLDELRIRRTMHHLVEALDDVLDVEAGLADATRRRLPRTVVEKLDDSLDIEAGLAQILSTDAPRNASCTGGSPTDDDLVHDTPLREKARRWRREAQIVRRSTHARWLPRILIGSLLAAALAGLYVLTPYLITRLKDFQVASPTIPFRTSASVVVVALVPVTIVVLAICGLAWRSLGSPLAQSAHTLKLMDRLAKIAKSLWSGRRHSR
jgi:hypothetical protein